MTYVRTLLFFVLLKASEILVTLLLFFTLTDKTDSLQFILKDYFLLFWTWLFFNLPPLFLLTLLLVEFKRFTFVSCMLTWLGSYFIWLAFIPSVSLDSFLYEIKDIFQPLNGIIIRSFLMTLIFGYVFWKCNSHYEKQQVDLRQQTI